MRHWQKIGRCVPGTITDRFWHAGLSIDGQRCFVGSVLDEEYFVWDVQKNEVIWVEDGEHPGDPGHPDLQEWISGGFIEIEDGPAQGKYRVFGFHENYPLDENPRYGLRISDVSPAQNRGWTGHLVLQNNTTGKVVQRLEFDDASGDFAFASFSEDGSMLAVLTAYDITFFAPQETNA